MTWNEPAFPQMPEPKPEPAKPKRKEEVRTSPEWRKHAHKGRIHCDECLHECQQGERRYPWQSSWIRIHTDGGQTLLCYEHAAHYRDAPRTARERGGA